MNIKLISDSGDEPVSLAEVVADLRYTLGDQDSKISGMITAARNMAEIWNGRQMTLQSLDLAIDRWPGCPMFTSAFMPSPYLNSWPSDPYRIVNDTPWALNAILLPAPLVAVQSVSFKDSAGTVTTLVEDVDYIVDTWKEPGVVCPAPNKTWPTASLWPSSAIHVRFTSGMVPDAAAYTAAHASDMPVPPTPPEVKKNIKQGMLLLINQWFSNRIPYDAIRSVAEPPFAVTALLSSNKLWK